MAPVLQLQSHSHRIFDIDCNALQLAVLTQSVRFQLMIISKHLDEMFGNYLLLKDNFQTVG